MSDWLLTVAAVLLTLVGAADEDRECLRLGALDALRVTAFVENDPDRLQGVYVSQEAVTNDRDLLRDYSGRGLTLRGGALERLECRVTERSDQRIVLDVVDRLGPTWVVDEQGRRRELPRSNAERRAVTLVLTHGSWRIEEVRSVTS